MRRYLPETPAARWLREHQSQQTPLPAAVKDTAGGTVRRRAACVLQDGSNTDKLMVVKLERDLQRLALQPSREARHRIQQTELLPSYQAYLDEVLACNSGSDNPVLIQCMIWRFNVHDIGGALQLANYALRHQLAMPDGWKASVPAFVCREVAYWALQTQKAGDSPQPWLAQVFEQSRTWEKPDPIEALLLKAMGQAVYATQPDTALAYLQRAAQLDHAVGVAQMIKRLTKQLHPATTTHPPDNLGTAC